MCLFGTKSAAVDSVGAVNEDSENPPICIDEITTAVRNTLTLVIKLCYKRRKSKSFSWSQARVSAASCPLVDRLPCGPGAHHARSAELECSPICCPNSGGIGAPLQATSAVVAHHTLQSTDVGNRAQSYLHRLKFVGNCQATQQRCQ